MDFCGDNMVVVVTVMAPSPSTKGDKKQFSIFVVDGAAIIPLVFDRSLNDLLNDLSCPNTLSSLSAKLTSFFNCFCKFLSCFVTLPLLASLFRSGSP